MLECWRLSEAKRANQSASFDSCHDQQSSGRLHVPSDDAALESARQLPLRPRTPQPGAATAHPLLYNDSPRPRVAVARRNARQQQL
eukprot:SAG25_NODE_324_length_9786_cov_33.460308_12_plen_86_part_00